MWLKFLIALLVVAFCTLLGYFFAEKWRQRKKFYQNFERFHKQYLNELTYARKPLSQFLTGEKYGGDFGRLVEKAISEREPTVKFGYLTKEERARTEDYFKMVGRGDSLSQKNYFSSEMAFLAEKRAQSEKEAKSKGELYLKLGLLAGLAIVILII